MVLLMSLTEALLSWLMLFEPSVRIVHRAWWALGNIGFAVLFLYCESSVKLRAAIA